nr:ORF8 protein [Severe acute respiratory syndrome coronavirus 2]UJK27742.1 ORF8 protein [Severe acute respiratory syndrome coronavirus 2]UZJ97386.1 ORF8 protein [Severe acute respiratory syndrome coronavirus 2]UZP99813.1 ORF8 protein [Severe acute respiratory syndrome coronavirus 2]WAN01269.1 ORF8 protein [Severe acute respiratory syndrome coronavirus 2]
MKFLVFLGIITTVAAFHQECSLQSCTQHQPYVVDDRCPIHFYSKWYIRVGARKSAPLIELCVDEAGSKSPIQYIDIGNYTVSCLPFTINCQEPKLGSLVVRCSFYEDFLEYHDVRVVLDFI